MPRARLVRAAHPVKAQHRRARQGAQDIHVDHFEGVARSAAFFESHLPGQRPGRTRETDAIDVRLPGPRGDGNEGARGAVHGGKGAGADGAAVHRRAVRRGGGEGDGRAEIKVAEGNRGGAVRVGRGRGGHGAGLRAVRRRVDHRVRRHRIRERVGFLVAAFEAGARLEAARSGVVLRGGGDGRAGRGGPVRGRETTGQGKDEQRGRKGFHQGSVVAMTNLRVLV